MPGKTDDAPEPRGGADEPRPVAWTGEPVGEAVFHEPLEVDKPADELNRVRLFRADELAAGVEEILSGLPRAKRDALTGLLLAYYKAGR